MKREIYVFNDGEMKRKDNTLLFETESGKKYIPVEEINNIWFFGEVTLNKTFWILSHKKKFACIFLITMDIIVEHFIQGNI